MSYRICFVCLGNICRSPMAEVVMRHLLQRHGLEDRVEVSSAGTGDWHIGERADERTMAALAGRGYDASEHRARQFAADWFADHDLVVALDRGNLAVLQGLAPADQRHKVKLMLSFDDQAGDELDVPDPYYGGTAGFDHALDLVERACRGLLERVRRDLAA